MTPCAQQRARVKIREHITLSDRSLVSLVATVMKRLNLIVALSKNGVLGAGGRLPWHVPVDRQFFMKATKGDIVIMGRRTFEW